MVLSDIWKISVEELKIATQTNSSLIGIIKTLNLNCDRRLLKRCLNLNGIDYSHISLGLHSNKNRKFYKASIPLSDVLKENSSYKRGSLKKRLIENGTFKNECVLCGQQPEWQGKKLVMVLDHINGINNDNRLENLRLLCPNCNSQTETFAGRNSRKYSRFV